MEEREEVRTADAEQGYQSVIEAAREKERPKGSRAIESEPEQKEQQTAVRENEKDADKEVPKQNADIIDDEYRKKYGVPPHFRTHEQLHKALRTMERELPRRTNELNNLKSELEQMRAAIAELKDAISKNDEIPEETLAAIAEKAAAGDQKGMAQEMRKLVKEVLEKARKSAGAAVKSKPEQENRETEEPAGTAHHDAEKIAIAERELMIKHGYVGEREDEYYREVVPGMYRIYQELCQKAGVDAIPITVEDLYDLWRVRTHVGDNDEQTKRARREAAATVTGTHRAPETDADSAVRAIESARTRDELRAAAKKFGVI